MSTKLKIAFAPHSTADEQVIEIRHPDGRLLAVIYPSAADLADGECRIRVVSKHMVLVVEEQHPLPGVAIKLEFKP